MAKLLHNRLSLQKIRMNRKGNERQDICVYKFNLNTIDEENIPCA